FHHRFSRLTVSICRASLSSAKNCLSPVAGAVACFRPSGLIDGFLRLLHSGILSKGRVAATDGRVNMRSSRFAIAAAGALLVTALGSPSVADVISDWNKAVVPPPPELKEVTVDPSTTALLLLDIMKAGCSAR